MCSTSKFLRWTKPGIGAFAAPGIPHKTPRLSYFVPLRDGIFYSRASGGLAYHQFASGKSHPVTGIPDWDYVFSAAPDGSSLITSYNDFAATDLMIVRNFR